MFVNILSYFGMSLQSEVCLWTLLGLVRTIFDATLFKVNANLKQVWQMTMPPELSLPLQRVLRTVISGVMLVQCFTVYVYLASYIVLLYPVFLEERPTLVLPWLLLAAIRKLLCELTSLALGLGTCVVLGAARPPCIKFVILKAISIMPAFYMWMLIYSYYDSLKVSSVFKNFSISHTDDNDYGLELAIRRRRTKSLLGEDQLRKLVIPFNNESLDKETHRPKINFQIHDSSGDPSVSGIENVKGDYDNTMHLSTISHRNISDIGCYEDWFGSEVRIPRDTDRILEQFGVMMLRIGAYLNKCSTDNVPIFPDSQSFLISSKRDDIDCTTLPPEEETPISVGNSKVNTSSYIHEYPQIFNKRHSEVRLRLRSDDKINTVQRSYQDDKDDKTLKCNFSADDNISVQSKNIASTSEKLRSNSKGSIISQKKAKQDKFKKIQENVKSEPIIENSEMSISHDKKIVHDGLQSTLSNNQLLSNTRSSEEDKNDSKADHSSQTSVDSTRKATSSKMNIQDSIYKI
ncbi:uncharacterized protein LOC132902321 [Amyelois transitella]|uniref:uncharacterized protein LOC132902321 n=1 Tax=Amyelois transitella TaxID=680683 RepID=UPI00298FB242|nr:uncharacterized protein LOC132902321 [Amyelois transitella]